MKPDETKPPETFQDVSDEVKLMDNKTKLSYLAMILCFIYAGICIIQLVFFSMSFFRAVGPPPELNVTARTMTRSAPRWNPRNNLLSVLHSGFGLIISTFAGFTLMGLLRKKEKKELTKSMLNTMLTIEEKQVIDVLEENDNELTQSELVSRTKLSKVKVSRVIKRLESLKVVSKYPYGVTNKIKLEKQVFEEK